MFIKLFVKVKTNRQYIICCIKVRPKKLVILSVSKRPKKLVILSVSKRLHGFVKY